MSLQALQSSMSCWASGTTKTNAIANAARARTEAPTAQEQRNTPIHFSRIPRTRPARWVISSRTLERCSETGVPDAPRKAVCGIGIVPNSPTEHTIQNV